VFAALAITTMAGLVGPRWAGLSWGMLLGYLAATAQLILLEYGLGG